MQDVCLVNLVLWPKLPRVSCCLVVEHPNYNRTVIGSKLYSILIHHIFILLSHYKFTILLSSSCFYLLFSARRRRTVYYVIFTDDQVHILPGYPKQLSQDPPLASIAFYLQFPPGSSNDVMNKHTLVSIVTGSLLDISRSINGKISTVETLFPESTPANIVTEPTQLNKKESSHTRIYIIAGCIAGGLLLIIVVSVFAWRYKHPKKR